MSPVRPHVTVVGRRLEAADHTLRDFLTRIAQPFEWHDADSPEAQKLLAERGAAGAELPVLVEDGGVIPGATIESVAKALLGARVGDTVELTAPKGTRRLEVVAIG